MGREMVRCLAVLVILGGACWAQSGITIDGDLSDLQAKSDAMVYYDNDAGETDRYGYDITEVILWRYFYNDGGTWKADMYIGIEVSGTPGDADGDGDPDYDDPNYANTDFTSIGSKFFGSNPSSALSEYVVIEFWADSGDFGCGVDYTTNWHSDGSTPASPYDSKGYAVGTIPSPTSVTVTDSASAPYTDFAMASSGGDGSGRGYEMVFRDFHASVTGDFDWYLETNAASGPEDWMFAEPTGVVVSGVAARPAADAARVSWQTGTEADVLGFNVWAADTKIGPYTQLNRRLIPAEASGGTDGAYQFIDRARAFRNHQYYRIETVSVEGRRKLGDPVELRGGEAARLLSAAAAG